MNPNDRPWAELEDGFLHCPIPAAYLAEGALRHRTAESIRWRRRKLGIHLPVSMGNIFVPIGPNVIGRTPAMTVDDFPGVDWDMKLKDLQRVLGVGQKKTWELRRDAIERGLINRPFRAGRRKLTRHDFPGVDWRQSIKRIMKQTGVSRPVATRLKREQ